MSVQCTAIPHVCHIIVHICSREARKEGRGEGVKGRRERGRSERKEGERKE